MSILSSTTFRIAWRNLWRNRRRTALALAAIGLSVALVLIYDGILHGYGDWALDAITGPMLSHVQVHARGWRRTRAMDGTVPGVSRLLGVLRRDPDVTGATARLYAPALAAREEEGVAVIVMGLDVAGESRPGRLLAGITTSTTSAADHRVLMGRVLAEQMGVRRDDVIAIVGQGVDGSLANDLFTVVDLIETPVDLVNRQAVVMPLTEAQDFFAMRDEAHELMIYGRDSSHAEALAAHLAARPELAGLEVLDWRALAPGMVSLLRLLDVVWIFVLVLILAAAAAGIANTMLMATFERTHELGMLLALGTSPSRVVRLVLMESLALGVTGALMGAMLGAVLVMWSHHTGFDYAALTGRGPSHVTWAGLNLSLIIYPRLTPVDLARTLGAVVITSVLASAWPAARAARLQPARALRD